jgi:hypothetical protein
MEVNETLVLEDHTTLGIWPSIASHNATETDKFVGLSGVLNYLVVIRHVIVRHVL